MPSPGGRAPLTYTRSVSQAAQDPIIGRLIDGRYQVRSRIARGGMATVYLATDLRLERQVALKVMHSHLTDDTAFRDRFIQEARSAARLAHPNVVNVFDQGTDGELAYLVMEYLPGITLRELLQEHGQLTTVQTIDVADAILSGLSAAHRAGIVHRDLKPENVLLADDGRIKIGDFGLARAASAATATGQALLGTVAYLSPELVTRGVADTRSDLYAVGIMLYEMLTGEQPFKGDQPMQIAYQHANESVPAPSAKVPGVPPEVDELVLWATSRDAAHRPKDAGVLLDALREAKTLITSRTTASPTVQARTAILPETPVEASTRVLQKAATAPVGPNSVRLLTERTARASRRGPWLLLLVLMLAAVAGTTGWWYGIGPGSKAVIPDLAGATVTQAQAALIEAGVLAAEDVQEVWDPVIEAGKVAGTFPEQGATVNRGVTVTIFVSKGPEPLPVPKLVGMARADAEAAVINARFTLGEALEYFDADAAAGTVIKAQRPDGKALAEGDSYLDQRPIVLVLSLGPLPEVRGKTIEEATAALAAVGLSVVGDPEIKFHDNVEKDKVIQVLTGDAPVTRGDGVRLQVSKGPDLVTVPDVYGRTAEEAISILEKAGFKVDYTAPIPSPAWVKYWRVEQTDPAPGAKAKRGSTVRLVQLNLP